MNPGRFADQPLHPRRRFPVGAARAVLWLLLAAALAGNVVATAIGANVVFHLASIAVSGACIVALTAAHRSPTRFHRRR